MPLADVMTFEWAPGDAPDEEDPTWVDFTAFVEEGNIRRGRPGIFDLYGPGSMTLGVKNGNHAGGAQWVDLDTWYRHRRIRATFIGTGGPFRLFTGYVDDVDHDMSHAPMKGEVLITAQDAGGLIANLAFTGDTADLLTFGEVDGFPFVGTLLMLIGNAMLRTNMPLVVESTDIYATNAQIALPEEITGNLWQVVLDALETEHGTLQVGADGVLYLNGRYTPWSYALVDSLTWVDNVTAAAAIYAFRRGPRFSKPGSQYRNDVTAKSRWLETPVNIANVPAGYPAESYSRNELLWIRQPWVTANANLWANIYSQTATFPQKIQALLWGGDQLLPISDTVDPLWPAIAADTLRLGVAEHDLTFTPPGDTVERVYRLTPEAIDYDFDKEHVLATVSYSSRDAWDDAYDLGVGLFTLDGDADHGLDGTAILAP